MNIPARLLALLAAVCIAFGSGWYVRGLVAESAATKLRDATEETQRLRERGSRVVVKEIDHATEQRRSRADVLDAADRDELYRLRLAAAAGDSGDSPAACQPIEERFAACRSALAESSAAAAEGAALARKLETQAAGLRDYATGLGRLPVKP